VVGLGRHGLVVRYPGPKGTVNLMKGLEMANAWDIKTRIEDQKLSKVAISTAPTDMKEARSIIKAASKYRRLRSITVQSSIRPMVTGSIMTDALSFCSAIPNTPKTW
jgi:hypothetical protein